jgi:hypothetical protein
MRLFPAIFAAWLAFVVLDFVGHGVAFAAYWRDTGEFWRPPIELLRLIPLSYAMFALYCWALVWLARLVHGDKLTPGAGVRFGALAGLFYWGTFSMGAYSVFRMPLSAIALLTLWGGVESAGAGGAAAWVGLAARPWRRVGVVALIGFVVLALGVLVQNLLR